MRIRRVVLTGAAVALTVAGLTGCRTSPNVAAYVGDQQVTVAELRSALDARLQDDGVAAFAEAHQDAFTRQVLSLLVGEEVYAAAADHWHVAVSDAEVRDRIDTLLAGNDPAAVYAQLAAQGIGREDVVENVRQQLVRQKIAHAEGLDDPLSEAALRQRYEQARDQYKQYVLGYIAVPDQATADDVLARLTAAPASYPQVAAGYQNQVTLPAPQDYTADRLPGQLAQQVLAARPGTGFTVPIQGIGVVVAFLADVTYQPFEDVRGDLANAAATDVNKAAEKAVQSFRDGLDVRVNPRYGVLQQNAVVESTNGVVDILGGSSATPSGANGG